MEFYLADLAEKKDVLNLRLIEEPFSKVHIYTARLAISFSDVIVICSFL